MKCKNRVTIVKWTNLDYGYNLGSHELWTKNRKNAPGEIIPNYKTAIWRKNGDGQEGFK